MNYEEFSVVSGTGGQRYDCRFYKLITAISLRHSDTVDVQFLVNGQKATVSLPHEAFAQYRERAGRPLTDAEAIQTAGLFLKGILEKEGWEENRLLLPSTKETLALAGMIQ